MSYQSFLIRRQNMFITLITTGMNKLHEWRGIRRKAFHEAILYMKETIKCLYPMHIYDIFSYCDQRLHALDTFIRVRTLENKRLITP